MNNKEKSIHNLHQARTAYIKWLNSVKLMISGVEMNRTAMQPDMSESAFGQWFYDEAMLFAHMNCNMTLANIEKLLDEVYQLYTKIYLIYFGEKTKGLKSFFGAKHRVSPHEVELATRYYEQIVVLSDQFKGKLKLLESQWMSYQEDKFDDLAVFSEVTEVTADLTVEAEVNTYCYGPRGR